MKRFFSTFLTLMVLVFAGCHSPQNTVDSLRKLIADYSAKPTQEAIDPIEITFNKLDAEIQNLQTEGKTAQAEALLQSRRELKIQFTAARMAASFNQMTSTVLGIGEAFRQAGEDLSNAARPSPSPSK